MKNQEGTYRLVVCIDVEAESLEDAYGKVYRKMGKLDREHFQWESSDEAFLPDGTQVTPEEMQAARMAFFESPAQKEAEGDEGRAYIVEEHVWRDRWEPRTVYLSQEEAEDDPAFNPHQMTKEYRITEVELG